jgi:hypothetical protein
VAVKKSGAGLDNEACHGGGHTLEARGGKSTHSLVLFTDLAVLCFGHVTLFQREFCLGGKL